MVLVDTSIWVDHLRTGNPHLEKLLMGAEVVCHPFIIGELACGNLKHRSEFLTLLQALPLTPVVDLSEYLYFVDRNQLQGAGIGFVDVHLLASAKVSGMTLWTGDKRLKEAAKRMKVAYGVNKIERK